MNGPKKNPFVSQPLNHFPPNSKQASGANKRGNSQGGGMLVFILVVPKQYVLTSAQRIPKCENASSFWDRFQIFGA